MQTEIRSIAVMIVICFDLSKLATMNPPHEYNDNECPPHVDNTDTLYLGDQHCQTDNVRLCIDKYSYY